MGTLSLSATKYYRISVSAFFFIQGLVFSSWASRIPDIKDALHLNEAVLGSVLFALPVGQLSAMALSGYLVSRYGSKLVLTVAALLYPAALVGLGAASSIGQLTLGLFLFGITANPSTRRESASNGSTTAVSWRRSTACGRWPDSAEGWSAR